MSGLIGLMVWLSVGHADDQQAARAAIRTDSGWTDVGQSKRDPVGLIQIRHQKLADVDCLEATAKTADLSLDIMKQVVLDIRGNVDWSTADLKSSVVLRESGGRIDYVQVADVPAPLSDRYWFLTGQVEDQGSTWVFAWERIDGAAVYPSQHAETMAHNSGAVEVSVNVGSWSFAPAGDGQTQVRFRSCTNIGGSVPRWAGERAARMMLPNNIVDLVNETRRRQGPGPASP